MFIDRVQIKNFRCFVNFDLQLGGDSITVVAPNAGGKTTLLTAIGTSLGGPRTFTLADFRDPAAPLEIICTLRQLDAADQAAFRDAVQLGTGGAFLSIGIRAIYDRDADHLDVVWGYPERDWTRAGRAARERLPLIWLPADRSPERLAAFVGPRSLLERVVNSLNLDQPLDDAVDAIKVAVDALVATPEMAGLLQRLDGGLGRLIPDVLAGAFDVEPAATDARDLLRQFQLSLSHEGPQTVLPRQSNGLAQLAMFVIALELAAARPSIALVDEPETSLHPQPQRALVAALRRIANQTLVSTHSSSVLSGADPRNVVRLKRDATDVVSRRPTGLSAADATKLIRYATPDTAEAFFAKSVVFVEGPSDYLALRQAARVLGIDLDARGVALVSLQGAGLLQTYLSLLGPNGLDLTLLGLCDVDAEADWLGKLTATGIQVTDRATLNAAGFFVCDVDLEDELVRALGDAAVQAVIAQEGEAANFATFTQDPAVQQLQTLGEQLAAFARKRKTRWSPRLAAELTTASVPTPIEELLNRV